MRRPPPITSLRIADPELPRRRQKRSQIVELKKSDRPNKLRFDDAGEPIGNGAPAAEAAEDGSAEEPEQGRQQSQERAASRWTRRARPASVGCCAIRASSNLRTMRRMAPPRRRPA